jgi:hypothetical protein
MRLLHSPEGEKSKVDAWKSPSEAISLLRKYRAAHQEAGNNGSVPAWLWASLLTIWSHFSLISLCHKASETYHIIVCVSMGVKLGR